MPIEVAVWRIGARPEPMPITGIDTERRLEDMLAHNITILDRNLMLIGRQIPTAFGKLIDLLAIDGQGDLTIVEIKRDRTPREVVAQILDYASWVQTLSYTDITAIFQERNDGRRFEEVFAERFGIDPPESLNQSHRLVIVASELDNSTERIVGYLSTSYGVPINAVFFRYFKDGAAEYLTRTWLIEPNLAEVQPKSTAAGRGVKEAWNGQDWYVSLGVGIHRDWEDCRRYSFVSAGQGCWYSNTLQLLPVGARLFVCVPKRGYVGVAMVKDQAVRVHDFRVAVDGEERPILAAHLHTQRMDENADDADLSEYLVRVDWIKTVPLDQAIWEKGMFANQNSACKLRSSFTIERLVDRFGLRDQESVA